MKSKRILNDFGPIYIDIENSIFIEDQFLEDCDSGDVIKFKSMLLADQFSMKFQNLNYGLMCVDSGNEKHELINLSSRFFDLWSGIENSSNKFTEFLLDLGNRGKLKVLSSKSDEKIFFHLITENRETQSWLKNIEKGLSLDLGTRLSTMVIFEIFEGDSSKNHGATGMDSILFS